MSKSAAAIKKRSNHLSTNEEHHHPWPNLPLQLISLLPRQNKLMYNITSFGGVTKTWRSTPKQCSKSKLPQLVEINTKRPCTNTNHKNMCTHIFDIEFDQKCPFPYDSYYKSKRWRRPTEGCFKGYSNGCLFYFSLEGDCCASSRCRISWAAEGALGSLPPLDLNRHPFKSAAVIPLVGNSTNDEIIMVLTGLQPSHTFAFFDRSSNTCNKWEWNFRDYAVKDPYNPGRNMEFCHGIGFNGKFYFMSLQGSLVVMEGTGTSGFEITGISKTRAVPCKLSRQYREFFVELNGEVLLVFLISRKSVSVVDDVEVLRLNVSELLWVKVESLGEGALFLEDECCMGVKAEKIGCRKNCIYFTHSRVDDNLWFVYDMEIGQIFPASHGGPRDYMKWDEPIDLEDPMTFYCHNWRLKKWRSPVKW